MRTGLVLGAGGLVGMAYHAGVLRALEVEAGFVADDADLVVGTSAGAVIGAYLRSGWNTERFWSEVFEARADGRTGPDVFAPTFRTPIDLVRRGLGSAYVLSRSLAPWPVRVPALLKRVFPGGLFSMVEGKRRFPDELPDEWPDKALWLCAVDIVSGRRVVLGREKSPRAPLARAVLASCAIPGVYEPVQVGRRTLIDGGVKSTTNLDLAAKFGCDVIIGIAPLAFDTAVPPGWLGQLVRQVPARQLSTEMAMARRRNAEVVLFRPSAAEVTIHGLNLMRPHGLEDVAKAAYDATAGALQTDRCRAVFGSLTPA